MRLELQPDRPGIKASGGTRYVSCSLLESPGPEPQDTVFVLDLSPPMQAVEGLLGLLVQRLAEQFPAAPWVRFNRVVERPGERPERLDFAPGSAWREAWLRGCHAIARERPQGGHCVLLTDGHPTVGETDPDTLVGLAGAVWENTGIATSVMALGPRPQRTLLRAFAWRGGGSYCRVQTVDDAVVIPPAPRLVLELEPASGRVLSPVRHLVQGDRLAVVVNGLRHVEAEFTFRNAAEAQVRARLRSGELDGAWETLTFAGGRAGPRDARVMRRVATALARHKPQAALPSDAESQAGTAEGGASLLARFVPARAAWPADLVAAPSADRLRDLARGCLLWGAAGSALGRGLSGLDPATIRARYGQAGVREFQPFIPGLPDSAGMVSGDVQMLGLVCNCLIACGGSFDPEDFGKRLLALLPRHRGVGAAAESAATALMDGTPWYRAGLLASSGGNGAALRAAPVGLVWSLYPSLLSLYRNAVLSAVVTHTHAVGVAGAVIMASAVAWCIRQRLSDRPMERAALLRFLADLVAPMEASDTADRRSGARIRMSTRLLELEGLLDKPADEALAVTWNGAFALESVPAALYCFLSHVDDPRQAVQVAVNAGFDSDSVGSMTGHLAGAWNGVERMQRDAPTWWSGLEWRDGLHDLADRLAELALQQ